MNSRIAALLLTTVLPGCGGAPEETVTRTSQDEQRPEPPGEEVPPPVAAPGEIVGVVFEDRNRNRAFEVGEEGMGQQTVRLLTPNASQPLQSTTSGTDGSFRFEKLVAGDYRLTLQVPEGFERTTDDSFVVTIGAGGPGHAVRFGLTRR